MNTQAPEVKQLVRRAFPEYNGKRFTVEPFTGPVHATSYWSGGSRDYWALVRMTDYAILPLPENGTPFSNGGESILIESLPDGVALVRRSHGPCPGPNRWKERSRTLNGISKAMAEQWSNL